jgi:hypothetical protein
MIGGTREKRMETDFSYRFLRLENAGKSYASGDRRILRVLRKS